jgi:hypothetical protein
MLHYTYFHTEREATQFRAKAKRLGWTCSTPFFHAEGYWQGGWSVCTNWPFAVS